MIRKFLAALAIVAALSAPVHAGTWDGISGAPAAKAEVFEYGMTGLLGQAGGFSLGVFGVLDETVAKYPAVRAYKSAHYKKAAIYETIKANYRLTGKPIVLVGHSLGGDAEWWIAHRLKADGIPVAAVFSYDQTPFAACVPDNVIAAIGFTRTWPDLFGGGVPKLCPGNTKTALENHGIAGGHVYIDDDPNVHRLTVKHVGEVLHMIEEMKGGK